jgi:hypothetical protein
VTLGRLEWAQLEHAYFVPCNGADHKSAIKRDKCANGHSDLVQRSGAITAQRQIEFLPPGLVEAYTATGVIQGWSVACALSTTASTKATPLRPS